MILYKHGVFGVWLIFRIHGSVFPRAMAWSIPAAFLATGLFHLKVWMGYTDETTTAGLATAAFGPFISILGFMVVFRSNQAWSRFWEGGTLVQTARGQWFNATSSLFAFCTTDNAKQEEVIKFQQLLVRLMSLLFATALSSISDGAEYQVLALQGVDPQTLHFFEKFRGAETRIELILNWVQRLVVQNTQNGVLPVAPPILARVFNELSVGVVNITSARKINDIPFPFHYAQMLSVMLILFSIGVPSFCAYMFKTWVSAATISFLNVSTIWSVNYLAVEIETPFGQFPNDLPLAEEVERMNSLLRMLLLDGSQRVPGFSGNELSTDAVSHKYSEVVRQATLTDLEEAESPAAASPTSAASPADSPKSGPPKKRRSSLFRSFTDNDPSPVLAGAHMEEFWKTAGVPGVPDSVGGHCDPNAFDKSQTMGAEVVAIKVGEHDSASDQSEYEDNGHRKRRPIRGVPKGPVGGLTIVQAMEVHGAAHGAIPVDSKGSMNDERTLLSQTAPVGGLNEAAFRKARPYTPVTTPPPLPPVPIFGVVEVPEEVLDSQAIVATQHSGSNRRKEHRGGFR